MNRISRNISIILRSERLIAQRQLAVLRRQTLTMAAAGIAAAVALIMLNLALYLWLSTLLSPPASALIVALINSGLAGVLVMMAGRSDIEQETAPVVEVRDMAIQDLESEVRAAAEEAKAASDAIRKLARDPFGSIAPGVVGPLVKAVLKSLKS